MAFWDAPTCRSNLSVHGNVMEQATRVVTQRRKISSTVRGQASHGAIAWLGGTNGVTRDAGAERGCVRQIVRCRCRRSAFLLRPAMPVDDPGRALQGAQAAVKLIKTPLQAPRGPGQVHVAAAACRLDPGLAHRQC